MLIHIKMKSGEDLVASVLDRDTDMLHIDNPIQIRIHPVHGLFAKSWMLLSKETDIVVRLEDILYTSEANDKAIEYYESFMDKLAGVTSKKSRSDYDGDDAVAEMLESMLEAQDAIKH